MIKSVYDYDATVIVAAYNPDKNKALETLRSILLQTRVKTQIIVADDGSTNNYFSEYRAFFEKKHYKDYILLGAEKNAGTIRNFERCTEYCSGKYIKLISPGDFLCDSDVLYNWISYMEMNNLFLSVADAVYYERKDNNFHIIREHAFPQAPNVLNGRKECRKQFYQLVYNDYWLGAATLMTYEFFAKYIGEVRCFAKFGEDNMYRLAACDNVPRGYYECAVVFYECNTGVSSLGEKGNQWHSILMDEWAVTNEYIVSVINNRKVKRKLKILTEWKMKNKDIRQAKVSTHRYFKLVSQLVPLYLAVPEMLFWSIKRVIAPRKTTTDYNKHFLECILDVD